MPDSLERRYADFFMQATALGEEPLPYQERLALDPSLPALLDIPTGLGKTAAAILAWVWRRRFAGESVRNETPRRLVYCLPMRVLVEQTYSEAVKWLHRLGLLAGSAGWTEFDSEGLPTNRSKLKPSANGGNRGYEPDPDSPYSSGWAAHNGDHGKFPIGVHLLLGGEAKSDWALWPERDAILIGTQDMLISRALNRGYGMSRYRWPMDFGGLNNDCLWVFDEVQLMDVGAATSAQLEAFRRKLGTSASIHCMWMSATLESEWLDTVDFDTAWLGEPLGLADVDKQRKAVRDRREALKPSEPTSATINDSEGVAKAILSAHQAGSRTLVVLNTVDRAVDVYEAIKKQSSLAPILIHSRFRARDRHEKMQQLLAAPPPEGTIAITTQVVEAGVDVSAKTLFTDLAPWASLVQRFGRCNRHGEFNKTRDARICWFDWMSREQFMTCYIEELQSKGKRVPKAEEVDQKYADYLDGIAKPYSADALRSAREHLILLDNVDPASLQTVSATMELKAVDVIRRRDFLDLFDTTPDLAGNDVDVSRFIRSGEELDVQVFWREVLTDAKVPNPQEDNGKAPRREELCSVPAWQFRDFARKKRGNIWRWNPLDRRWAPTYQDAIYPGQIFLVRGDAGGYDGDIGWNPKSTAVQPIEIEESNESEAYDSDQESAIPGVWQTIAEHTDDVVVQLESLLATLPLSEDQKASLIKAARWHDFGKAHPVFQNAILATVEELGKSPRLRPGAFADRLDVGKAPHSFWQRYERRHFRHELASAIAMLQEGTDDLAVYLAAAHHGKVRLSIRSLPGETAHPDNASGLYARGIWDGDELPEVDLGAGVTTPHVTLSLECMQLGRSAEGRPSWTERMLKQRDQLGPFRLAYLEALFRAADIRASRLAERRVAE